MTAAPAAGHKRKRGFATGDLEPNDADNEDDEDGDGDAKMARLGFDLFSKTAADPETPNSGTTAALNGSNDMYKSFVQNALFELDKNNPVLVQGLTSKFTASASIPNSDRETLTPEQQWHLIQALTFEIGRLDRPVCNELVAAILQLRWYERGDEFMLVYARFLGVLVSGIPRWYTSIVSKLVAEFAQPQTPIRHSLLEHVVGLVPTARQVVAESLHASFPHKSEPARRILRYTQNMLQVVEYVPEVQASAWRLITEKLIELDAELQVELDEDEEEEELESSEDEDEDRPKETVFEYTSDSDEDVDADNAMDIDDAAQTQLAKVPQKLDKLLVHLLDYITTRLTAVSDDPQATGSFYALQQHLFQTHILSTYQTKSVQYLVFSAAHTDPAYMDAFLALLVETVLSPTAQSDTRVKAAQYVASFVARARGIHPDQLRAVVSMLGDWLTRYVQERELEVTTHANLGLGMARFRVFYAVAQALMYIFCFRRHQLKSSSLTDSNNNNDIIIMGDNDIDSGSAWVGELDELFRRLIVTKFNPLRYCQRTIVAMFAQLAQRDNLVYCYTVMEQNRLAFGPSALASPAAVASTQAHQASGMLDSFFPFDPLVLPATRRRVAPLYVEWGDVAGEDDDSGSDINIYED